MYVNNGVGQEGGAGGRGIEEGDSEGEGGGGGSLVPRPLLVYIL